MRTITVKELREQAKAYGIKGRWDMNKDQLIEAIRGVEESLDKYYPDEVKTQPDDTQKPTNDNKRYIDNLEKDTLVAFEVGHGDNRKVLSGKFVKEVEDENVEVETKKGTIFTIPKKSIIWVRTGARWPKWVFALFRKRGA